MGYIKDVNDIKKLLGGLDKYGLDEETIESAFQATTKQIKGKETVKQTKVEYLAEEDFLLLKSVVCPICDNVFSTMRIKSGRARRIEPDLDLRPRCEYIDVNKYDVTSCRKCGYTALNQNFSHLTAGQMQLISEGVRKQFKVVEEKISDSTMDYDTAIDRYKLALYNAIMKRGRISEKSYLCLKIAWLYRGKIEKLIKEGCKGNLEQLSAEIECARKEEIKFYDSAYEGFIEARQTENFPICGMDSNTYDVLLAAMAYNLDKIEDSSRLVASILISRTANSRMKNRALDLKERILERKKEK